MGAAKGDSIRENKAVFVHESDRIRGIGCSLSGCDWRFNPSRSKKSVFHRSLIIGRRKRTNSRRLAQLLRFFVNMTASVMGKRPVLRKTDNESLG